MQGVTVNVCQRTWRALYHLNNANRCKTAIKPAAQVFLTIHKGETRTCCFPLQNLIPLSASTNGIIP